MGASLTNVTTDAQATSNGIIAGNQNDKLFHDGVLNSTADSRAIAASISVNIGIAYVPGGAALADTSVTAASDAIGISALDGNDYVESRDSLTATATATATGVTVAVNVLGASLGDANVMADANAIGIDGGQDRDVILHYGDLTTNATANSTGASVSVTLVGAALSDATNSAFATSIGLNGGTEKDFVENYGTVSATANATARATGVAVTITGAALNNPIEDANTVAEATAIGIAGDTGRDQLLNAGTLNSTATATTLDVEVAVVMNGAAIG